MSETGRGPEQTGALRLTKHHGAGNDFLVLLDADGTGSFSAPQVRVLCDRHRGVGADGVIRVTRGAGTALVMELRNADGETAEMSGNGIRCAVQAAVDARWVEPGPVTVDSAAGRRVVEYRSGDRVGLGSARVDMGQVRLGAEATDRLPAGLPGLRAAREVDVGNPHLVVLGDAVDDATVRRVGAALERSVPGGTNVEFVWPGPGDDALTLRVWERGVGETLACGTGACAAVAAAHGWGVVGTTVAVHSPGGTLEVELRGPLATLSGPTEKVAEVTVASQWLAARATPSDGAAAPEVVTSRR